jgi:HAD superfamily hydrolase (TIGR01509 family)
VIEAVVFDLDGVLIDSEQLWDAARRELVEERGGSWRESATTDMLGMSSREWPRYVRDELGVDMEPDAISDAVVERVAARYRAELPLLPGAVEAVRRLAERWRLGLATSANREIIDLFLELGGLGESFAVTLSTEEVGEGTGKPAPDVYLEACRRLGVAPARAAAVEDSTNGLRAAHAAGMHVIAAPNPHFPPQPDSLGLADRRIRGLDELTVELVERLDA